MCFTPQSRCSPIQRMLVPSFVDENVRESSRRSQDSDGATPRPNHQGAASRQASSSSSSPLAVGFLLTQLSARKSRVCFCLMSCDRTPWRWRFRVGRCLCNPQLALLRRRGTVRQQKLEINLFAEFERWRMGPVGSSRDGGRF